MSDHYRELFNGVPCGFITVDGDGAIDDVNATLLAWLGRTRSDLVGFPFLSLLPPADQMFFETRFTQVLHLTGEVREVTLSLIRRDGVLPVLMNARQVVNGDEPAGMRIAVFDATQRQDYERQLLAARREAESSETRVRVLRDASIAFDDSTDEKGLAELLVAMTRDAMAATSCAVILVDEDGATSAVIGDHPLASRADDPAVRAEVVRLRSAGAVALSTMDEVRAVYPGLADGLVEARIEGFSLVPIQGRGSILGAVMCFFGRRRELADDDMELQFSLARQAALVLTRIRLQEELMALALHDHLTGVANRRLLREHLIQGLATAARRGRPISLLVLDLDGFKSINDERGHQAGDTVLKSVADRISGAVRIDDVVGRFGGDEFIVICHDADESVAREVAERLRVAISEDPDGRPDGSRLSASVGIAICDPEKATTLPEDFFAVADAALLQSKRDGKNRITVTTL
jgi:diguanylate cyclase (GGDEF)-like protein/PAS domain S-box-containing protein